VRVGIQRLVRAQTPGGSQANVCDRDRRFLAVSRTARDFQQQAGDSWRQA